MRTLPDQFLTSFFGAWLALQTQIWTKPPLSIFIFSLWLGFVSLCLGIVFAPNVDRLFKTIAFLTGFTSILFSGVALLGFEVLSDISELVPFYLMMVSWLMIGGLSAVVEAGLPRFKINVIYNKNKGG